MLAYVGTLAPGVTFWDAGEFIAAVHVFGIPHPPGTPLYIAIARAWSGLFPALETAVAVNLLSAVATVIACVLGSRLIDPATRPNPSAIATADSSGISSAATFAAVMAAGTMSTVWLNATEAEVYGISLLLCALMLYSGLRAGGSDGIRWVVATGYLFAVSSPLHLGALVAAPAAIVLAAWRADTGFRSDRAIASGSAAMAAASLSLGSMALGIASAVLLVALALLPGATRGSRARLALAMTLVIAIALSAQLILLIRAGFDPAINQGNPATLDALLAVITREQYAVAPLWPRQAPLWMQVGNFLEYVDWQVALGLAPGVAPSPWRTPFTLLFIALGIRGSRAHREGDRPTWRAMLVLLLCATIGVIVQLNLKAGPSFGYGILPDDAPHEPRERDYFFALGFWSWGLWAGLGAVASAREIAGRFGVRGAAPLAAGIAVAALPIAFNWRAVDRGAMPDATLPHTFAIGILESTPPNAVLFTWGDNDTYPLWYAREVEGIRRDVSLVTVPLLPARWYREELARRTGLADDRVRDAWLGQDASVRRIANAARAAGRPIATVITMPADERRAIGERWSMHGLVHVSRSDEGPDSGMVDTAATRAAAERVATILAAPPKAAATDPTARYVRSLMECPRSALAHLAAGEGAISLAPVCNLR